MLWLRCWVTAWSESSGFRYGRHQCKSYEELHCKLIAAQILRGVDVDEGMNGHFSRLYLSSAQKWGVIESSLRVVFHSIHHTHDLLTVKRGNIDIRLINMIFWLYSPFQYQLGGSGAVPIYFLSWCSIFVSEIVVALYYVVSWVLFLDICHVWSFLCSNMPSTDSKCHFLHSKNCFWQYLWSQIRYSFITVMQFFSYLNENSSKKVKQDYRFRLLHEVFRNVLLGW